MENWQAILSIITFITVRYSSDATTTSSFGFVCAVSLFTLGY
ncbi:hypothetical protein [Tolypothrix sp. PCC 7910]|nr:hypothetical protein [Tolypothrix sp. PCC 7910]